jgi:ribosomal protein S1
MMDRDDLRAASAVKEAVISALSRIYYQHKDDETQQINQLQKDILTKIISWINSRNKYVMQAAARFFSNLPAIQHSLVRQYLQENIERNYKLVDDLLSKLQSESMNEDKYAKTQQRIDQLLAQRRDLATVVSTVFTRVNELRLNQLTETEQELEQLLANGEEIAVLLRQCCLQSIKGRDEQSLKLNNLISASREVLWTLYNLVTTCEDIPGLLTEELATLRHLEVNDSCRLVLALFRARNSGEEFDAQLNRIAYGTDKELIRVCVEIERQIQTKGRRFPLSELAVKFIPKQLGQPQGIPNHLASRFLPLLAEMETPEATNLIKSLLILKDDRLKPLIIQLREALSEYHCYHLRDDIVNLLLQDQTRRHKNRESLRLDYLNLLRAGDYQRRQAEKVKLQFPQENKLKQRVIKGIQDIQANFQKLELPVLFPPKSERKQVDHCVVALESMSPHSVNTLLYKVDGGEDEQIVKAYLRHSKEEGTWVFLDRALTDKEIVQLIIRLNSSRINADDPILQVNHPIVGRVEAIAANDCGVYVNIGFYQSQYKSVFVSKAQLISDEDEGTDWQNYISELLGSVLKFQLNIKINTTNQRIIGLELSRREFWIDPLEKPEENTTVRGSFIGVHDNAQNPPCAVFQVEGRNKNLQVPLPELSWRSDSEWLRNWRSELSHRENEVFEITYSNKNWSLRNNTPKAEYFLQLLYEKGQIQEQESCQLIYVDKRQEGYVFEIEPGKLCYIPAEFWLEIELDGGEDKKFIFVLNKYKLSPGSILKFIFTKDGGISDKQQVILKVVKEPISPDVLSIGMTIFGILQHDEKWRKSYLTPSPIEQPPGNALSDYTLEIVQLPEGIKRDSEVSGIIQFVDRYNQRIRLKYIDTTSDALELGQSYKCRVTGKNAKGLLLRYAHFSGFIYENNITYAHNSVLSKYQQGSELTARLVRQVPKSRIANIRIDHQMIERLGLEQRESNGGDVINFHRGVVTFEDKDQKYLTFALSQLQFANDVPYIGEGDRIHFSKVSAERLEMKVESVRVSFTIRPELNQHEQWFKWDKVLKIDHPVSCVYVGCRGFNYLFEYQHNDAQPMFFTVPITGLRGISMADALYTGNYITLTRSTDNIVQLRKFEPGFLHFAAEPEKFDTSKISWMPNALATSQTKIPIVGRVINTNYENGILLELECLSIDTSEIRLRNGIQAFFRTMEMSNEEQEYFRTGNFLEGDRVEVILDKPPQILDNGKLLLTLKSSKFIEISRSKTNIALLKEKLGEIRCNSQQEPSSTWEGKIGKYVEMEGAFRVTLDELSGLGEYDCWLPDYHVTRSLVHSYRDLEDFGDELNKTFTVIFVAPDAEPPELEVSLIENYPKSLNINIEEAVEKLKWSDGTILNLATFLGIYTESLQNKENSQESQESVSENITEIISVEIKPGLIVDVPIEKFFVEGLPYKSGGEDFDLQRGDQITLRVKAEDERSSLDVVKFVRAEFNLLSNKHKPLVAYGRITGSTGSDKVKLKLEGYSKVQCYLDPDFIVDINKLVKRNRILFRVSESLQPNQLYFKPIEKQDLKAGERLLVTYKEVVPNPERLRVSFGENLDGYINKFEITYQPGFDINQFNVEPGYEYNAVVKQDVAETSDAKFSLKKPFIQGMSYFLNRYSRKPYKAVLITNDNRQNYLDIEVKPNEVVRVPYSRFWEIGRHRNDLKPGDVLIFNVIIKPSSQVYLRLENIEKNNLLHYLAEKMLVRAELTEKIPYRIKEKFVWIFSLPDYGNIEGKLETKDNFRQDIGYENLRLKVNRIPSDPTRRLILGERAENDKQQMLQVESSISGDRLKMHGGDGKVTYLDSYYATYRINNQLTYLKKQFKPGQVVVATKINVNNKQLFSLRYHQWFNKPLPFSSLRQSLQPGQKYSDSLDLTYVGLEGKDRVFELKPGRLIAIPVSSLYFYEHSLEECNFQRFLPGDVFTIRLEILPEEEPDNFKIVVLKIELCILHDLQKNQLIEAEVKEVTPEASGIVIKAKHLELEHFVTELLPENSVYDYKIGQSIRLIVTYVNHNNQQIQLKQLPDSLSLEEVLQKAAENDTRYPVVFYGNIQSVNSDRLIVDVLKKTIPVFLDQLSWSNNLQSDTVASELLLPEEKGLWVSIYKNHSGKLYANPKSIRKHAIRQLKNSNDKVVIAQVLKLNQDNQNNIHSVLLEVDGVRTLITHQGLVRGTHRKIPAVERGMWLPVCIESVEYDEENYKKRTFSVSSVISSSQERLFVENRSFAANVYYTLPHGLVFSYKQALGYVANEQLTWSNNAKAQDMFAPGDKIQVYEIKQDVKQYSFSLKHSSQIEQLQIGQEVEAEVNCKTDNGVYIKVKNTNIFVLLSCRNINYEQLEKTIVLRLEDINNLHQIADFRLIGEAFDSDYESSTTTLELIHQQLDCYYMTAFKPLDLQLKEITNSEDRIADNEDAKQGLITLLKHCNISCTYINIRKLMKRLYSEPHLQKFLRQLVDCDADNEVVYILSQVARKLNNLELQETYPHLTALSHYAVGIVPILDQETSNIEPIQALEHLLTAYRHDKALDIQIVLFVIYDQLGYFKLRQAILQQIITRFSENINWLLKLPLPLELDKSSYKEYRKYVPGLNEGLDKVAESIKKICDDYLYLGEIPQAEQRLKEKLAKARVGRINMPELALNLAICRTIQGDWQGALGYLEQAVQTLSKGENRERFPSGHQAYYQLAMYVNYQLGRFPQVQNLMDKGFQQDVGPWLETLLGYIFFASGNRNLSQDLIKQRKQSPSVLKQNVNGLEHILLDLYWQDTERNSSTKLEGMKHLRQILFQDEQSSSWTQPTLSVRLFPNPQRPQRMKFEDIVSSGKQYDVPDYALQKYYQKPSQVKLAKKETVEYLVNMALGINKPQYAQNILQQRQDAELSARFYQELLLNNDFDRFLKDNYQGNQSELFNSLRQSLLKLEEAVRELKATPPVEPNKAEYSGDMVMQLIERWIKSPYERELIGQKLINLLKDNPALCNLCWSRQDLRTQMWQALDSSLDYGSVVELIPTYLSRSPLMELLITLEKQELCTSKDSILSELVRGISLLKRGEWKIDEVAQQLLPMLYSLNENCLKLVEKITFLQQDFEQVNTDI